MTNEEIVQEISDVLKMNQRAMTPEQIAVQQRANELVLRIGRIGDDETMSPIFYEALMNERRIAIEEEREGCAAIADAEYRNPQYGNGRPLAGFYIASEIRARSKS